MSEIIEYHDERTGVRGWLAYDGSTRPLAAGGCRAQSGVDSAQLAVLAQCMTLKQRILGVNVDGAKCGIDIDPASPDKPAVLGGFLAFLRDELRTRFSMGPDMGTDWQELQGHARCVGLPSVKYAIRVAQGMDDAAFAQRMALLDQRCGQLPFSQLRAGHALGHAALAAARIAGVPGRPSVSLQGFGNLARGAAHALHQEGARLVAVADEFGTVVGARGLDVPAMLAHPLRTPVTAMGVGLAVPLFDVPADVLVLAGPSDAVSVERAATLPVGVVVVGANCGLSEETEETLYRRGVLVVPDFIGGIGGSASMETLFGPVSPPSLDDVLRDLGHLMWELVMDVADTARRAGISPRRAALDLAAHNVTSYGDRPYGRCRYLVSHSA
jgi:glutamate dehydrogenase (NAD(P)+)